MKKINLALLLLIPMLSSCAFLEKDKTDEQIASEQEQTKQNQTGNKQNTEEQVNSNGEEQTMGYQRITGEEAADMMKEEVIILDVRTEEEYAEGHIPGAVLLPYDTIRADSAAEMIPDQKKTVLVYCRTGRRSEIAAMTLVQLGYGEVYDFGGIMTDWNGDVVK